MASWQDSSGPARVTGVAVSGAVLAAQAGDREQFERSTAALVVLPAEQTGLVLGAVVRQLLEDQHIDGIDSADLRELLASCYRNSAAWLPPAAIHVPTLVAVLSSALGIHEPGVTYREIMAPATDGGRTSEWVDPEITGADRSGPVGSLVPTTTQYTWHASLVIADLLDSGHQRLSDVLDRAFGEIARSSAMEVP